MANAHNKSIDTTSLQLVLHTAIYGEIHRDYLAHCLRYSHVLRVMQGRRPPKVTHLLDVGCGQELPLARTLHASMNRPTTYTGVDYGKVNPLPWNPDHADLSWATILQKSDFVDVKLPRDRFNLITSFEVLEHVEPLHAFRMLQRMRGALDLRDGTAYVSTPCYDPHVGAAKNHVNEMSHAGFRALLEAAGFTVDRVWGTFASQRDYKGALDTVVPGSPLTAAFEALTQYYDSSVTACLLAPLFPAQARNCMWRLKAGEHKPVADLKTLADPRHGSSALWTKHLKQIAKEASK